MHLILTRPSPWTTVSRFPHASLSLLQLHRAATVPRRAKGQALQSITPTIDTIPRTPVTFERFQNVDDPSFLTLIFRAIFYTFSSTPFDPFHTLLFQLLVHSVTYSLMTSSPFPYNDKNTIKPSTKSTKKIPFFFYHSSTYHFHPLPLPTYRFVSACLP
jgi:hypothetical protein